MRDRDRYMQRVGSVVDGKWRLDELLGTGATSAVYRATHRNGHEATLKILHRSLCTDVAACARFLREAGTANAIKHPAIVPVRDDGITDDGCAYLVLEYFEGETLEEKRNKRGGKMPYHELSWVLEKLIDALAAVHAAGVVHRDFKPQNVFQTTAGDLKLLDFGTARIFDTNANQQQSVQGLVLGTPAFMSPEQARGARDEIDARSDVWSLGATIFTMLSGELVHPARDAHARLLAAASKPARSLATAAPDLDPRVVTIVDRALSFAKDERWQTVLMMCEAFRNQGLLEMAAPAELHPDAKRTERKPSVAPPDKSETAPTEGETATVYEPTPSVTVQATSESMLAVLPTADVCATVETPIASVVPFALPIPTPPPVPSSGTLLAPPLAGLRARRLRIALAAACAIIPIFVVAAGALSHEDSSPVAAAAPAVESALPVAPRPVVTDEPPRDLPPLAPTVTTTVAAPAPPSATARPSVSVPLISARPATKPDASPVAPSTAAEPQSESPAAAADPKSEPTAPSSASDP